LYELSRKKPVHNDPKWTEKYIPSAYIKPFTDVAIFCQAIGFVAIYYFPDDSKMATTVVQLVPNITELCPCLKTYLLTLDKPYIMYVSSYRIQYYKYNGVKKQRHILIFNLPAPSIIYH
jgi:hypothetical protein